MNAELNSEQFAAATHLDGPLLIQAGAGSGKTRTLAERFVRAVTGAGNDTWRPVDVEQIVTITFTEKAAGELSERVRASLRAAGRHADSRRVDSAWISTIHALCSRILRRHALEAGLDPYFGIAEGVTASLLGEEAFESAAMRQSSTPHGAALLATYGYRQVREAVRTVTADLEARGLSGEALTVEPRVDAVALLDEARAFFDDAHFRLAACGCDSGASMAKHTEQCAAARDMLAAVDEARLEPHEIGREIRRAIARYTQKRGVKTAAALCEEIVEHRNSLLARAAAVEVADCTQALSELAGLYIATFRAVKEERCLLDFSDLQRHTVRLLRRRPDIARHYQKLFRVVMVDEFQDTDALQLALVNEIASENLCTVGDERQSIYRFRGADIDVYTAHNDAMERSGACRVSLEQNYRSHPDVLGFVNTLFSHESLFGGREFAELLPGRPEQDPPRVPAGTERVQIVLVHKEGRADSDARTVESSAIAERIERLLEDFEPGECVILLRTYTHAAEYAHALARRGIPASVVGGSRFFGQPETAHLRAFCRTVINGDDDHALALFLGSPLGGLSLDDLARLGTDSERAKSPGGLWRMLTGPQSQAPDRLDAMRSAVALVERARRRLGDASLSEIVLRATEESGYDLWLLADGERGQRAYANVLKFARMAATFERSEEGGMAAFLDFLDAKERLGDHERPAALADDDSPGVRIMSIHASKGLEFPVVAVPELAASVRSRSGIVRTGFDGELVRLALCSPSEEDEDAIGTPLFDELDRLDRAADAEETRRLMYVACTRAEEVLLLSGAANLDKPPTQNAPLAWLRQALGEHRGDETTKVGASDTMVSVTVLDAADPHACVEVRPGESLSGHTAEEPDKAEEPTRTNHGASTGTRCADQRIPRMTYSDAAAFKMCPLRFQAERIWRTGALELPLEKDSRRFGSALHALMREQLESPGASAGRLERVARSYGLDSEEQARLERTSEVLLGSALFAELDLSTGTRAEVPFQIAISSSGASGDFVLAGAMDLYVKRADTGVVVDYKTGTSGTPDDLRERYALQAKCYALAALRDGCARVTLEFVRPEVVAADAEEPQRISFAYEAADAPSIEADIREIHARMTDGPHVPLTRWDDRVCRDCPIAGGVCPLSAPDSGGVRG